MRPSEFIGLPLQDIQTYLDVNHPGHRIYAFSIQGNENIQLRIVGPIYNLTITEKKR